MLTLLLDRGAMDCGDLDLGALERALPDWRSYESTHDAEVAGRIVDATAVISNKVRLDEAALRNAQQLRLICIAATGTNHVDLEAAKRRGIAVCNVRGYATPSVVQHVFALILALSIRLPDYQRALREGRWQASAQFCLLDYPIREIAGKTLGIIGYGELGQAVARVAEAFGMTVLVAQRAGSPAAPGRMPLHEMLPQLDVLSLHCPLAPETRGLIGVQELALMKPDALLINTARGGIVDEEALAEALHNGRLGGAGVDVLREEPPVHGNPLLTDDVPNLIVTPHIAWASRESRQRLVNETAENIRAFFSGIERNRVV
ncbi:MAG: 2-hydroxyacid dehydrogenase [Gammaproteobacteria bacterium]